MCDDLSPTLGRHDPAPMDDYRSRFAGRILDFHTHFSIGNREAALEVMRISGAERVVNLLGTWPPDPFPAWKAGWEGENDVDGMILFHAPNVEQIGRPGFGESIRADVAAAFAAGAAGLKLWKNIGLWLKDAGGARVPIDDSRLSPIWETAAEHGRPVAIHVADPPEFFQPVTPDNPRYQELLERPDWSFLGAGFPSLMTLHDEFERLLQGNPDTTFVGLHFGCFVPLPRLHQLMARYPNLWLDTAARVLDLAREPEVTRRIFGDFGDRIVFGSDVARMEWLPGQPLPDEYPNALQAFFARNYAFYETASDGIGNPFPFQTSEYITGIALGDDALEHLYFRNAERLLHRSAA